VDINEFVPTFSSNLEKFWYQSCPQNLIEWLLV
jgi:hypothetical protein